MTERVANSARGEALIEIGGESYVVRYPFSAMKELKERFGESVQTRMARQTEEVDVEDVAVIIGIGLSKGGNPIDEVELLDMLDMQHIRDYMRTLTQVFGAKEETPKGSDPSTGTE